MTQRRLFISEENKADKQDNLLQLLLGPQVGAVTTGLLPTVGGPGVEPGVALPADHDKVTLIKPKKKRKKCDLCKKWSKNIERHICKDENSQQGTTTNADHDVIEPTVYPCAT